MSKLYDPKWPEDYAAAARPVAKPGWFHRHRWVEFFFDLRAEVAGGPRSYHGIGWVCACGKVEYGKDCRKDDLTAKRNSGFTYS